MKALTQPPPNHPRPTRWPINSPMRILIPLLLAAFLAACASEPVAQGQSRTLATYSFGTLEATLPDSARVQAVTAAADATLRARGYAVTSTRGTADMSYVYAKSSVRQGPMAMPSKGYVAVEAKVVAGGTFVTVKVGDFGDEPESRAILDDVLRRLSL